ncbi:hypothetical protein NKJ35_24075 [Mesorhizobium sp. M0136]|uniref:hypothetical protein n=1 Tax=Mesorhizobium sp. M0136 TaxID=2956890 RepID=UPI00333537F5
MTLAQAAAASAAQDAGQTAADRAQTGADRTQTGLDRAATGADAAQTAADRGATAADRTQTTLDRAATGTDAGQTAADRIATAADRVAAAGSASTASSKADQTAADVVSTNAALSLTLSARDAALAKGPFATTAAAIGFGVGSFGPITPGAGGTDGTFDLAFTGGAGSGAAGRFMVAGGALVSIVLTAAGSYTVVPAFSFAASAGLAGAAATPILTRNVDVGEQFWAPSPLSAVSLALYRVDAGPVATDTGIRLAPGLNVWPDPFGEQLDEFPWVRLSSSLYVSTYTGVINKPSTYPGFGKTGLMTAAGIIANRRISLAEIGAVVGDVFSFAMAANFAGTGNTMQIVFLNSAGGAIAGTLTLLSAGTAGYKDLFTSGPIPVGTVAIEPRAFSTTNTTELLAVACAKGDVRPLYMSNVPPASISNLAGPNKLNIDPFFKLARAGMTSDAAGPLMGVPTGGTASFVPAPALSPFGLPAVSLSPGTTLWDVRIPAADLGLKVNEPIFVTLDLEAAQSVQIISSIAVSSGVAHNESNNFNPAVAGGLGYKSLGLIVTPTANDVAFATSLLARLSIAGGVGANGLRIYGWSAQKSRSRLSGTEGPRASTALMASDAHAKLNYDPVFRLAAAGRTIDYLGNPLIGATAGGFPPVLVNRPAGSPFRTKAVKIPAGATLYQVFTPATEVGLTVGETVWAVFAFMTGSPQSINFLHQTIVSSGVGQTGQITKTVNGLEYISLPIVIDQNGVDFCTAHMLRAVPSGPFAADAHLLGWSIQKAPGRFVDNQGPFDRLAAAVAAVPVSPFAAKNQVSIGDSFTAEGTYIGANAGPGPVAIMAERTGWLSQNCALGGTRAGAHGANYNEFSGYKLADIIAGGSTAALIAAAAALGGVAPAVAAKIAAVDWAAQNYLHIAFGLNDYSGTGPQVPIGTNADFTGATFKGALRYMIETILTARPLYKLYFTTMCWRPGEVALQQTAPAIAYVDATIEIAQMYHLAVRDMYRNSGFNDFNQAQHFNGGHLIDFGQRNFGNLWADGAFQLLG